MSDNTKTNMRRPLLGELCARHLRTPLHTIVFEYCHPRRGKAARLIGMAPSKARRHGLADERLRSGA